MLNQVQTGPKVIDRQKNLCCSEVCMYIDKRLAGSIDCSVLGKLNSQSLVNAYNASSFQSILFFKWFSLSHDNIRAKISYCTWTLCFGSSCMRFRVIMDAVGCTYAVVMVDSSPVTGVWLQAMIRSSSAFGRAFPSQLTIWIRKSSISEPLNAHT